MPLRRSRARWLLVVLLALPMAPPSAARAAPFVSALGVVCTGTGVGECQNGTPVGAGQVALLSREWVDDDHGFHFIASGQMILDYCAFSSTVSASGYDAPSSGDIFLNRVTRIGRAIGNFQDGLTAGTGGAPGWFRIPLHVTGGVTVSFQNGSGSAMLLFQCRSTTPDGLTTIGQCDPIQLDFFANEDVDTVVNLDVPIVLGEPFEYRVTVSVSAITGHAEGDPTPFEGLTQATFGTEPFTGALVLDAAKNPIPDAPISASASGFVYAPEPRGDAPALAALLALAAAGARRWRRRAGSLASARRKVPGAQRAPTS
jgi:hypothetical protein